MYILIVSSGYPTEKNVGLGIFEFEQAIALKNAGHKVIFAAVDLRSIRRKRKWGTEHIERNGVEVWAINIPCGPLHKRVLNRIGILGLKYLYKKIYNKHGAPDVIHAHFGGIGFIVSEVFKEWKIPIVITEHSSSVITKNLTNYEIACLNSCIKKSNAFLCVSNVLKKSILEITGTNKDIMVVPNMVSSLFKYKGKNAHTNSFIFLSVGNLVESKRFALTIEAFTKVFRGNENIKLNIVGDGPLYGNLQKYIEKLKMNSQILLLGQLSRQEVAEKMQECDVFVLASEYETFGVVYIEALACGKPVIGTHNGGADDIINSTNGIIVDVNNVEQLAGAMKEMYKFSTRFDNQKISLDCSAQYGEKVLVDKLLNIYRQILW